MSLFYALKPSEVLTVVAGRQRGKSLIISALLVKIAFERIGSESYYIAPTNKQARHFYKSLIKKIPVQMLKVANAQVLELTLVNGSSITLLSGEQGDSLRGYTVKKGGILVYDEAAYMKDSVFEDTKPYVNVSKANVIMVSTPKFKSGRFYECYKKGVDGVPGYKSINWKDYDTSEFLSEEARAQYKQEYSKFKYLTEIEGEFITLDGSVFTGIEQCITDEEIPITGTLFMGIDFGTGSGNDYTAITIINSNKEVCYLEAFNNIPPVEQVHHIADLIKRYRPFKVTAEQNSIGKVYLDLLSRECSQRVNSFNTSNDSKVQIISELQKALEMKELRIPRNEELIGELSCYEAQKTPSGKLTFNGVGDHDDRVMSLAIALHSMSLNKGNYRIGIV